MVRLMTKILDEMTKLLDERSFPRAPPADRHFQEADSREEETAKQLPPEEAMFPGVPLSVVIFLSFAVVAPWCTWCGR